MTVAPDSRHICDVLIAERAPRLTGSIGWPLIRPFLYGLLGYGKARRMADAVAPMGGAEALDYVSKLLALDVRILNADRIPQAGRCVVVSNHPTGIADGIAAYDAIRAQRDDAIFFANADALRVSPGQFVHTLFDQPLELEHDAGATLRVDAGPALKGGLGGLHRAIHLGFGGQLHAGLHLSGVRIEDVAEPARGAGDALTVDEVVDVAHGRLSPGRGGLCDCGRFTVRNRARPPHRCRVPP